MASATASPSVACLSSKQNTWTLFLNGNGVVTYPHFSLNKRSFPPVLHRAGMNRWWFWMKKRWARSSAFRTGLTFEGWRSSVKRGGRWILLRQPWKPLPRASANGWCRIGETMERRRRVSFGRDPRITGAVLSSAAFAGLSRAGCEVYDMGLGTTPACFVSTILNPFSYDASIMMTASHLPLTRNGLKFFTKKGGLTSPEVEEICDRAGRKYANRHARVSTAIKSPPRKVDFMSAYSEHLRETIKKKVNHPLHYDSPLEGYKIIVNAGNGSGGFFTWDVLDRLGADTFGSLHLNPDGMFPNHIPNPEDATAMASTRSAVIRTGADLGIVFDTDVDRSGVVDREGKPHQRRQGGRTHCLYRVGYRNVIDKGIRLNRRGIDTHLMMETSGHGALKENHFLDDGAYMVVRIIIEMVRMKIQGITQGIGSLIKDLDEPLESVELRMNIISEPELAKTTGTEVIEGFRSFVQEGRFTRVGNGFMWRIGVHCSSSSSSSFFCFFFISPSYFIDRVKISDSEHGWIHLRQSTHNPNIAINAQSMIEGGCKSIAATLRDEYDEKTSSSSSSSHH
ncbi:hypothetical protein M569_13472 [Genlisea aurea]|uniref:Phosphoglucomutase n=1 Tax=Genlisea aurea TaxID=192259 RepID=S8C3V4_9LAMI|nr:hypothetical protein M569_13472 [Genlisea aurea]